MPKQEANMELVLLALERVVDLGQVAFKVHGDLERWRDPPFTKHERTDLSIKLEQALQEQRKWLDAMRTELEAMSNG